jgi:hypothetical protein
VTIYRDDDGAGVILDRNVEVITLPIDSPSTAFLERRKLIQIPQVLLLELADDEELPFVFDCDLPNVPNLRSNVMLLRFSLDVAPSLLALKHHVEGSCAVGKLVALTGSKRLPGLCGG